MKKIILKILRKGFFYLKVALLFDYVVILTLKDFIFQKRHQILIGFFIIVTLTFTGFWQIKPVTSKPIAKTTATPIPLYTDFHLLIPKNNIDAPVILNVDGADKDEYFKALQGGVAHFKGTAKPGEGSNIFIFGHSSFYFWDPGKYKEVFKPLGDLETNDEIILWYNNKEYKYKITESKLVRPDEVDILKLTKTEQITLMTCWPPGTTRKRLIIIGKPI